MFLLINKPAGPTSHDIINSLWQIIGIKKIGHAGTLDPFASGLLLVAVGRESTREISQFVGWDKEYQAILKLGATSDSYDRTGQILEIKKCQVTKIQIEAVLQNFLGKQEQTPPAFSAKKIQGQPAYKLARHGQTVSLKPQSIIIHSIKLIEFNPVANLLSLVISCSPGTYIRSLAHDIGQALGSGAYLEELERTRIGNLDLSQGISLEQITPDNWQDFALQLSAFTVN